MTIIAILAIILGLSKIAIIFSGDTISVKDISNMLDVETVTKFTKCIIGLDAIVEILIGLFILL